MIFSTPIQDRWNFQFAYMLIAMLLGGYSHIFPLEFNPRIKWPSVKKQFFFFQMECGGGRSTSPFPQPMCLKGRSRKFNIRISVYFHKNRFYLKKNILFWMNLKFKPAELTVANPLQRNNNNQPIFSILISISIMAK